MTDPVTYLARCAALRRRGLDVALVHQLQEAGNPGLLTELEEATDEYLGALSAAHIRHLALAHDVAAKASRASKAIAAAMGFSVADVTPEAVRRFAAAAGSSLTTTPLLWQDEGDQA